MTMARTPARACGLACSDCGTAADLRRQITELKAEISEWERQSRARLTGDMDESWVADVRARLGVAPALGRALVALLGHPGRLLTKERLLDVMTADEDVSVKLVDVQICKLRAAMNAKGAPGTIETVWGQGYRISPPEAAAIREWLLTGEGGRPCEVPQPKILAEVTPAPLPANDGPAEEDDDLAWLLSGVSASSVAVVLGWTIDRVERRRRELGVAA